MSQLPSLECRRDSRLRLPSIFISRCARFEFVDFIGQCLRPRRFDIDFYRLRPLSRFVILPTRRRVAITVSRGTRGFRPHSSRKLAILASVVGFLDFRFCDADSLRTEIKFRSLPASCHSHHSSYSIVRTGCSITREDFSSYRRALAIEAISLRARFMLSRCVSLAVFAIITSAYFTDSQVITSAIAWPAISAISIY